MGGAPGQSLEDAPHRPLPVGSGEDKGGTELEQGILDLPGRGGRVEGGRPGVGGDAEEDRGREGSLVEQVDHYRAGAGAAPRDGRTARAGHEAEKVAVCGWPGAAVRGPDRGALLRLLQQERNDGAPPPLLPPLRPSPALDGRGWIGMRSPVWGGAPMRPLQSGELPALLLDHVNPVPEMLPGRFCGLEGLRDRAQGRRRGTGGRSGAVPPPGDGAAQQPLPALPLRLGTSRRPPGHGLVGLPGQPACLGPLGDGRGGGGGPRQVDLGHEGRRVSCHVHLGPVLHPTLPAPQIVHPGQPRPVDYGDVVRLASHDEGRQIADRRMRSAVEGVGGIPGVGYDIPAQIDHPGRKADAGHEEVDAGAGQGTDLAAPAGPGRSLLGGGGGEGHVLGQIKYGSICPNWVGVLCVGCRWA